jgi:hypothetical protein
MGPEPSEPGKEFPGPRGLRERPGPIIKECYMLPVIKLNLQKLCPADLSLLDFRRVIVGFTFSFYFSEVRGAAERAGQNLDTFLSRRFLRGLHDKPVKGKALFWYAPHNEFIFLSVTGQGMDDEQGWVSNIPGVCDWGREPLRDNARPYMYWDGKRLRRIYKLPGARRKGARYVSDLGALTGLCVMKVDKEEHRRLRGDVVEHWDYCVLPEDEEESVTEGGKNLVLSHAFWEPGE